ncbi:MAG TPA: nucleotidyltransferase family protein [Pseudoxanthomonas sp.]
MSEKHPHFAIVLAAGGSRRLGRAKQLLIRDGETLVHRAVRLAAATCPVRLLLVVGAHAEQMRDAVADLRVEILFNEGWQEGLASSLRMVASALDTGDAPCLILACDQPAMEQGHLQRLLEGAASAPSRCSATAHHGAPGIPAVVTAALLQEARNLDGDRGLRATLRHLPVEAIHLLEAPELQFDLDTPADVEKAINDGLLDPIL